MEAINIELNREGLIKFREAGKEKKKEKAGYFRKQEMSWGNHRGMSVQEGLYDEQWMKYRALEKCGQKGGLKKYVDIR